MRQIYDVSCGKPVLHNTALQFNIDLSDADDSSCQVSFLPLLKMAKPNQSDLQSVEFNS